MNDDLDTAGPAGADGDNDGYIAILDGGDDCDDANESIHPDATEICNLVDDNCDGTADEGCPRTLDDSPSGDGLAWTCASVQIGPETGLWIALAVGFLAIRRWRRP